MMIDQSLFAHILLDAELQGLQGLQGNQFVNTIGYLDKFITTYFNNQNVALTDQLSYLIKAFNQLVLREKLIQTFNNDQAPFENLTALHQEMEDAINDLSLDDYLLLPGGWSNEGKGGHAMVYQFTKTKEGLLFSIHNSGDGIQFHEKVSFKSTERYYPVKSWLISSTDEHPEKLSHLVHQLILPLLGHHSARIINTHYQTYDATMLYHIIEEQLAFLDPQLIPSSISTPIELTTASQISGTCAQRVLHQLLKNNFATLHDYQRFIFQFKMHALEDFVQTENANNSSELIHLAIENNTKILKIHGLFTPEEQKAELRRLQQFKSTFKLSSSSFKSRFHKLKERYQLENNNKPFSITWGNVPAYYDNTAGYQNIDYYPPLSIDNAALRSDSLNTLVDLCAYRKINAPLWVLDQIEKTILALPLPNEFNDQNLDQLYQGVDNKLMLTHLIKLQQIYQEVYYQTIGDAQLPHLFVIICNFLALQDLFSIKIARSEKNTEFHPFFQSYLGKFLKQFYHNPYQATNDPLFDRKMAQLISMFYSDKPFIGGGKDDKYQQIDEQTYERYYVKLIDEEPDDIKQLLSELYQGMTLDEDSREKLEDRQVTLLYCLSSFFNPKGEYISGRLTDQQYATMKPLIDKFTRQFAIEQSIKQGISLSLTRKEYLEPKIFWDVEMNFYNQMFSFYGNELDPENKNHVSHTKYDLSPGPIHDVLMEMFSRSNVVQLHKVVGSEEMGLLFVRDLLHLRTSPANQVKLTLDYFIKSMPSLSDQNTQHYLEANLFELDFLASSLEKEPDVLETFDRLIQTGTDVFSSQDELRKQEYLFLIRLRFLVNQYLAKLNPDSIPFRTLAYDRLNNDRCAITALINVTDDTDTLATLHQYRFLTAINLHDLNPMPDDSLFREMLQSHFYIQAFSNPTVKDDLDMQNKLRRAAYHVNGWLNAHSKSYLNTLIKDIVINTINKPDVSSCNLSGSYPIFNLENPDKSMSYTVHAQTGHIFHHGNVYGSTPLEIKTHPLIHRLCLDKESSCFISPDRKHLEFITTYPVKQHVRVIVGATLTVQKKWPTDDLNAQWYELQPLNEIQRAIWSADTLQQNVAHHELPAIFSDEQITAWFNDKNEALMFKNHEPIYRSRHHEGAPDTIESLNSKGDCVAVLARYHGAFSDALYSFEDSKFILSHQIDNKEDWTFTLPRYGLSLETHKDQLVVSGTDYALSNKPSPFAPIIACLNLSNGHDQKIMIPVQRFSVASGSPSIGDYYPVKHDISNAIAVQKIQERYRFENIIDKHLWHYDHSATCITYNIVNGCPKYETAADALYLCYLYLSTHELDKAWALLDSLHTLEGNYQELTFLSWIVRSLPTLPKSLFSKEEDKEKIRTPRYVATQLKALALFTDALANDKKPCFPDDQPNLNVLNGYYQVATRDEVWQFFNQLHQTIAELFETLQQMSRHLEYGFTLNHHERLSLLNQCARMKQPMDGALGYEHRQLELKALFTEWRHLQGIRQSMVHGKTLFPRFFAQRMHEIEQTVKARLPIKKRTTRFIESNVDLTLPEAFKVDESLLTNTARSAWEKWRENLHNKPKSTVEDAMTALHPEISDEAFMIHFPWYVDILTGADETQKAKLLDFCVHYLKGHAHSPLRITLPFSDQKTQQRSNIHYLTHILYRLSNDPACINPIKNGKARNSWESTFTLKALASIAREQSPTSIMFVKAEDVFDTVLAINDDILEELDKCMPEPIPVQIQPSMATTPWVMTTLIEQSMNGLNEDDKKSIESFTHQYRRMDLNYQIQLASRLKQVKNLTENGLKTIQEAELYAGELKYTCVEKQRQLANTCFASESLRIHLNQTATALDKKLMADSKDAWDLAIQHANQKLNNPELALALNLEALAMQRRPELIRSDLLKLYFNAEQSEYIEMTGLSVDELSQLHQKIHLAVTLDVQQQHITRLMTALTNVNGISDVYPIANVLMSENHPHAQMDSTLMFFQYQENILLRPRQIEALSNLLHLGDEPFKYNETVEKVIMGGGKSKVILPVLAQKKATGANLVVVEVPRALLLTNCADLNATSSSLFNQKAQRFEFNRRSCCTPERLEEIYNQFINTIVNKDYLVTTGDAIQSLELKYIECLLANPKQGDLQLYWLSKITKLLRERGDVVIDEMHQGLELSQELNYTLGDSTAIHHDLVKNSINLFQFMSTLVPSKILSTDADTFRKMTTTLQPTLADALVNDPGSPLASIIDALCSKHGLVVKQELKAFLHNKQTSTVIENAPEDIRELFAFYKAQCSSLLPYTLSQKNNESYGNCFKQNESGAYLMAMPNVFDRALAIPYKKSQPREGSRFGNVLSTINFTIQSLLVDGLNHDLLEKLIREWLDTAQRELKKQPGKINQLQDTPMAQKINAMLCGTGFQLHTINLKNDSDLQKLLPKVQHQEDIIYFALQYHILNRIQIDPKLLLSNALNHVDLYNSVQGVSGTPYNQTTFHQRIHFNYQTSLGTDGYIKEILKHKQTPVQTLSCDVNDLPTFLDELYRPKARAIIDVGAILASFNPIDVATAIADTLTKKQSAIKYILYYDANALCALNIKTRESTVLGTSDPDVINQKLQQSLPHERFTYYDQAHTIGADLKQAVDGLGMVLIDEKTRLESFLQGAMRLRGLEENQRIELIVPDTLTGKSFGDLIALMADNEQQQLSRDNFIATMAKMKNRVRNDLMNRINQLDDLDSLTKSRWMNNAFKHYFVESQQSSLFEQYGQIAQSQNTNIILDQYKDYLIDDWKKCLTNARMEVNDDESKKTLLLEDTTLTHDMADIIKTALPFCPERALQQTKRDNRSSEVETQKEEEVMVEKEKEDVHEVANANLKSLKAEPWDLERVQTFYNNPNELSLNAWGVNQNMTLFDNSLMATKSYALTHTTQNNMLGCYVKPVFAILFRLKDTGLTACLITNEELDGIKPLLSKNHTNLWIGTTQHTLLAGNRPDQIEKNDHYQRMIEQIRFFNGEFKLLSEQEALPLWMNEDTQDKMAFFKKHLAPYRLIKNQEIMNLETTLVSYIDGLKFIQKHDFDLSNIMPDFMDPSNMLRRAWEKAMNQHYLQVLNNPNKTDCYNKAIKQLSPNFMQDRPDTGSFKAITPEWLTPILKSCDFCMVFFKTIARESNNKDVLIMLLEHASKQVDLELFNIFLSHVKNTSDHDFLLKMIPYAHSNELCAALLKANSTVQVLSPLIKKTDISPTVLTMVATLSKETEILVQLLNHPNCDRGVLNSLVKCSEDEQLLAQVLEHKQCDEVIIQMILEKKQLNDDLISRIKTKVTQPESIAMILNRQSDEDFIKTIEHYPRIEGVTRSSIIDYLSDEKLKLFNQTSQPLTNDELNTIIRSGRTHDAHLLDQIIDEIPIESQDYINLLEMIIHHTQFEGEAGRALLNRICERTPMNILKKGVFQFYKNNIDIVQNNALMIFNRISPFLSDEKGQLTRLFLSNLPPIINSKDDFIALFRSLGSEQRIALFHSLPHLTKSLNKEPLRFIQELEDKLNETWHFENENASAMRVPNMNAESPEAEEERDFKSGVIALTPSLSKAKLFQELKEKLKEITNQAEIRNSNNKPKF